ncbi:hypothetical protein NX10_14775 [Pseudomonas fluorescens]|uniref:hypothetical protein n=1 Tax=Pseudomonas fluorescens TaxID=294 RepID=UPI000584C901|nr:hypothetical protein [Pseudomonas fluorescens]KIF60921.1 hypothetical protein NX10_14775 [Pseudomonas fluorescens]
MECKREPKTVLLSQPYAPEMIVLQPAHENYHGGVSIEDGMDENGFEMIMLAYLNQQKGDVVRLYLNDDLVANTTIKEKEEAKDTSLLMPAGRFHSGLNRVSFGIKRSSQEEALTPELKLLYHSFPPGGTPPVLRLKASHTSVGPDEADKFFLTVSYNKANWYDRIHVICEGYLFKHQLVPETTSPLPPVPPSIDIPIPRSVFEQEGDSPAFQFFYYVVDYLTNGSARSLPLAIDVHLKPRPVQPPPTLAAPAVSPIDVLAYPNGVWLQIKDFTAQQGDKAQFVQVNAPVGAPPLEPVDFVGGVAKTLLRATYLAAWHGKSIEFQWKLIRAGVPAGESPVVKFDVKKIADEDSRLPTPNIAGNVSKELNVQQLPAGALILAQQWTSFKPGQPVWVTCSGIDKNGNPVSTDVRSGEPNDAPDGLSVAAPVQWLKELKEDTVLTVSLRVDLA